jgi:hypothetical protein
MSNKQAYIDFILNELNKGNVKYNDVCLLFCTKFGLTKQSFNKYWKQANEAYLKSREAIEKAKLEQTIEEEKKEAKNALYYRNMILQKMEDIISQKAKSINGQIIIPSYADVIRASERIAKMTGIDAPEKVEQTNPMVININGK